MNWDAAGAIGEVIGALAVVVTLLYLARQTRSNTRAVIAASTTHTNWGFAEFDERIAKDPELIMIIRKPLKTDLAQFEESEWDRFQFFARSQVGRMHDAYQQSQLGFSTDDFVDARLDFMRSLLERPAWRLFWKNEGGIWTKGFVDNVEKRRPTGVGMLTFHQILEQYDETTPNQQLERSAYWSLRLQITRYARGKLVPNVR